MQPVPTQPPADTGQFDDDDDLLYVRAQSADFEEKVKYRGLIRAWLAALRFDSLRSYEAYRPHINRRRATLIMLAVFALTPVVSALFIYPTRLSYDVFRIEDFLRVMVITGLSGWLTGIVLLLSIYAASHATAYVARRQFHSTVSGKEHYALSQLYFAPLYILGCLLMVAMTGITSILPYYSYYGDYNDYSRFSQTLAFSIPTSLGITLMLFTGYVIVQYIFGTVATHRVRAMPGILLTLLFMTVQLLMLAWTLPFVMAAVAQIA